MSQEITVLAKDDFSTQIRNALISRLPNESNNVDMFLSFFLAQLDTKPLEREIFKQNPAESIVILAKIMAMRLPLSTHDMYYLTTYKIKNKITGKYTEKIQLQVSYFGMMELGFRAGVRSISSQEVYSNDDIDCELGTNPFIKHKVKFGDRGNLIGYYCVAKTADETLVEIMSLEQMKIHSRKFAKTQDIWSVHFDQMARKTLVKKILKMCPKTPQLMEALKADDEAEYYTDEEKLMMEETKVKELPASPLNSLELKILSEKMNHTDSLKSLQDLWNEWNPRIKVSHQDDKNFLIKHKEALKESLNKRPLMLTDKGQTHEKTNGTHSGTA